VSRVLKEISPERLVAEDPRLTVTQAARIVEALRSTGESPAPGGVAAVAVDGPPRMEGDVDVELLMRRILVQVVATIPGAIGAAMRVNDGASVAVGVAPGAAPSLEVPFAVETRVEGALGVVLDDDAAGVGVGDADRRNLEAIASFAATSLAAARSITDTVGAVLGVDDASSASSRLIASVFGPTLERHVRLAVSAERVREVLSHLTAAFQPIVDLHERRTVGVEALTRFPPTPPMSVEEWFRTAADAGMSADLEIAALQNALTTAGPALAPGTFLAVNVSPGVVVTPAFVDTIVRGFDPARLVIEITEHAPVDDYRQLVGALRPLRNAGARLAIDDAGAGFASLRHVLRLAPDFIKLDLSLVHHIDADPVRRALATSLITFAEEVGATIVAEGIETRFELETLVSLGVRYGQGFHLGRPGPLA
jgi:EAL domain-containing protein (putative c-di-GMP-specific phosphodiesterase class I)